jgi:hypothetical protein
MSDLNVQFDEYEVRLILVSECGEWTLASVRLGCSPAQQLVCRDGK